MEYERLRNFQSAYYRRNRINNILRKGKVFFLFLIVIVFLLWTTPDRLIEKNVFPAAHTLTQTETGFLNNPKHILAKLESRGYPVFEKRENGRYVEYINGNKVIYSVNPKLQDRIYSIFNKYKVPYGSFIAIEPSTGKIMAYVAYSAKSKEVNDFNQKADYPMASLFKIITAAGVIEEGLLSRRSVIGYEGNPYKLNKRKIINNSRRDRNFSTLENALGKSNNVVFGKVGANVLGYKNLSIYAERFLFNQDIEFDFPLEQSKAEIPSNSYRLARVSAGFSGVKASPVHASLIASTVAYNGNMARPILVDKILNAEGKIIYQSRPSILKEVISPRAAREVKKMMLLTVKNGTGSSVFRKYAKKMVEEIDIAGKTGTLRGRNPSGLYDWFIGFAPADKPKIAIAALVVNNNKWRIKGTYVAQEALKIFLDY